MKKTHLSVIRIIRNVIILPFYFIAEHLPDEKCSVIGGKKWDVPNHV